MIKKIIFIVLLSSFSLNLFSNDSTWKKLYSKVNNLLKAHLLIDAEKASQKVLNYSIAKYGEKHYKTITIYKLLGDINKGMQKYKIAGIYYKKSLENAYKLFEPGDYRISQSLKKFLQLYDELGKNKKAFDIAYKIYENDKIFYKNKYNQVILNDLLELGKFSYKNKAIFKAKKYLFLVTQKSKKLGNNGKNILASAYIILGEILQTQKLYANASMYYSKALKLKNYLSSCDPEIARILKKLADMYIKNRNFRLAEQYLKKKYLFDKKNTSNLSKISDSMMDLAGIYYILKDYSKTEYYINEIIRAWTKKTGMIHPKVIFYINRLVDFYLKTSQKFKALKYKKLSDELQKKLFEK